MDSFSGFVIQAHPQNPKEERWTVTVNAVANGFEKVVRSFETIEEALQFVKDWCDEPVNM